jgi:hypothetical protein
MREAVNENYTRFGPVDKVARGKAKIPRPQFRRFGAAKSLASERLSV